MKKFLFMCLSGAMCLLFVPLAVYNAGMAASQPQTEGELHTQSMFSDEEKTVDDESIRVYLSDEKVSRKMNFRDYITGVVAAEMPAEFEHEALCAQAIACATYARRKMAGGSSEKLKGAVISTSPSEHQAFMSREQMKEHWGGDFDKYYNKIRSAVDETADYEITYNGEPIAAAFHAISPGKTESAENVWQDKIPYLVSVESEGDSMSPRFSSEKKVSLSEFAEKMEANGAELPDDEEKWLGEGKYSESGTLLDIEIGGKSFSGAQLRKIFSLRSAAVKISINGDKVLLSVKGYGHGVGMSQYGADYYARQGKSWREIVAHYYPGTTVTEVCR